MPNGNLLKQNLPKGLMKVVRSAESLSRWICQNPELASNLEKIVASPNCARMWSTDGIG